MRCRWSSSEVILIHLVCQVLVVCHRGCFCPLRLAVVYLDLQQFHVSLPPLMRFGGSRPRHLAIRFNAAAFTVLLTLKFATHCGWHRNFQLSTRILHDIFGFFIIRINEVNTTQSSGIVELRFFSIAHLCFALRAGASDTSFQISGHKVSVLEVVCFLVSLNPENVYPSRGFSFNTVNLVNPSITFIPWWVSKWCWRRSVWFSLFEDCLILLLGLGDPDKGGCSQNLIHVPVIINMFSQQYI